MEHSQYIDFTARLTDFLATVAFLIILGFSIVAYNATRLRSCRFLAIVAGVAAARRLVPEMMGADLDHAETPTAFIVVCAINGTISVLFCFAIIRVLRDLERCFMSSSLSDSAASQTDADDIPPDDVSAIESDASSPDSDEPAAGRF